MPATEERKETARLFLRLRQQPIDPMTPGHVGGTARAPRVVAGAAGRSHDGVDVIFISR
jgi:hypothetical protein